MIRAVLVVLALLTGIAIWLHRRRLGELRREARDTLDDLARRAAGGTPERPLEVRSASVVESAATELQCLACGHDVRVVEHRAEDGLRVLDLRCPKCGTARRAFVRILSPS